MTPARKPIPPRPTSRPSGWPMDKRSIMEQVDGVYFIWHPERKAQRFEAGVGRWKEVR